MSNTAFLSPGKQDPKTKKGRELADAIKETKETGSGKLVLARRGLTAFPNEVANLTTNLKVLDVSDNQLSVLPKEMAKLSRLTELNLASNQLMEFPGTLVGCSELVRLDASKNDLKTCGDLSRFKALQYLTLDDNKLTSIPASLGELRELRELLVRNNALTSLPKEIRALQKLRLLDVSDNQLARLPDEVGQLASLKELCIPNNQLAELPAALGNLLDLRILNIKGNKLDQFPPELVNCKRLYLLNHKDNPLRNVPEDLRVGLCRDILEYLSDPQAYLEKNLEEGGEASAGPPAAASTSTPTAEPVAAAAATAVTAEVAPAEAPRQSTPVVEPSASPAVVEAARPKATPAETASAEPVKSPAVIEPREQALSPSSPAAATSGALRALQEVSEVISTSRSRLEEHPLGERGSSGFFPPRFNIMDERISPFHSMSRSRDESRDFSRPADLPRNGRMLYDTTDYAPRQDIAPRYNTYGTRASRSPSMQPMGQNEPAGRAEGINHLEYASKWRRDNSVDTGYDERRRWDSVDDQYATTQTSSEPYQQDRSQTVAEARRHAIRAASVPRGLDDIATPLPALPTRSGSPPRAYVANVGGGRIDREREYGRSTSPPPQAIRPVAPAARAPSQYEAIIAEARRRRASRLESAEPVAQYRAYRPAAAGARPVSYVSAYKNLAATNLGVL